MNDIGIGFVANFIILESILSPKASHSNLDCEAIEKRLQGIQYGITDNISKFSTEEQLQKTSYNQL